MASLSRLLSKATNSGVMMLPRIFDMAACKRAAAAQNDEAIDASSGGVLVLNRVPILLYKSFTSSFVSKLF